MATNYNLSQAAQSSGENTELLGLLQGLLQDDQGGTTAPTITGAPSGDTSEMLVSVAAGSQ
jgi:hypothetical protein